MIGISLPRIKQSFNEICIGDGTKKGIKASPTVGHSRHHQKDTDRRYRNARRVQSYLHDGYR
jgi:hypothetical protein